MGAGVSSGGLFFTLISVMTRNQLKALLAAALLALLILPISKSRFGFGSRKGEPNPSKSQTGITSTAGVPVAGAGLGDSNAIGVAPVTNDTMRRLKLTVLAAENGLPLPGVVVERGWVTEASFISLRDGTVPVTFPKNAKELRLTTRVEGFADTCLKWSLERGEKVPDAYTLKLERAVQIGGSVVDPDGKPVAGAKIGFGYQADPSTTGRVETHEFGYLETISDAEGRWRLHRIAEGMLRRTGAAASHPELGGADRPWALKRLTTGNFEFYVNTDNQVFTSATMICPTSVLTVRKRPRAITRADGVAGTLVAPDLQHR